VNPFIIKKTTTYNHWRKNCNKKCKNWPYPTCPLYY